MSNPNEPWKVYDRLSWYEGNDVVYGEVKRKFALLMEWLREKGLLSLDGKETMLAPNPIGSDFCLYEGLLNEKGVQVIEAHYQEWTDEGDWIDEPPDFSILEKGL